MDAAAPPPAQPTPSQPRLVAIAPARNTPTDQNEVSNGPLMPYTCVTCARRKVKCDKSGPPCSTCRKARQKCHYTEPAPRKRKRKPVDDLQQRLERYEKLLKENGIVPKEKEISPPEPSPDALGAPNRPRSSPDYAHPGTLVKGKGRTRYINSSVWANLGEDLHPSEDEEDTDYDESQSVHPIVEPLDPVSIAFFGSSTTAQSLLHLHPTYDVAMKLWKVYVTNVDPIVKMLHIPTTLELVQRAAANPSGMSKVTECLVFSIYQFAIASMEEKDCEATFGYTKSKLFKKYTACTRQSLVACHFLKTTELAVLQAYMMFLLAVRNSYDPHTLWILTGIAVRIAQRMGLHRDGEELGLKPFDVQMRRRVFWQLLPLDGLSGQLSGTGIAITADSWDTKQPLNVNDEDIWPGMETPPVEGKQATDMIFCLARSEIGRFQQKVKPHMGNWAKFWEVKDTPEVEKILNDLENTMEEKYIRYCDISNPVHCLTIGLARGAVNSARLKIKLGAAKGPDATLADRKDCCTLAIKVLDVGLSVLISNTFNRYNWHLKAFFQWDPLIWLLNETRRKDCVIDPEVIWAKVEDLYNACPEMIVQKRSIDIALSRLVLKSWDAARLRFSTPRPDPGYIVKLREMLSRREKASRQTTNGMGTAPTATTIATTTTQAVDPYDPAAFATPAQILGQNYSINSANPMGYSDYNLFGNFNAASIDWAFWDQFAQESGGFSA